VAERGAHNLLVVGSIPTEPINSQVLSELSGLRQLVEMLLGNGGKKRLELPTQTNPQLFEMYEGELTLRHRSKDALYESTRLLKHFHAYLGAYPPSASLAKSFLGQFAGRKPICLSRYASCVKGFMRWYGDPIDDVEIHVGKKLPDYISDDDTAKLRAAISSVKTHKKKIIRNTLLVDLDEQTGMRCEELQNLDVGDIYFERNLLVVREGKEDKDRVIPLLSAMLERLKTYIQENNLIKGDRVFQLCASRISGIMHEFSVKAGTKIHTHSFRYKFATNLNEKGVDIRKIQLFLGHNDIGTTERYISVNSTDLRDAINTLEKSTENKTTKTKEAISQPDEPKDDTHGEPNRPILPISDLFIEVYETSFGQLGETGYLYFPIAKSITPGQHVVQLLAFAEGKWRTAKPFSVDVPTK